MTEKDGKAKNQFFCLKCQHPSVAGIKILGHLIKLDVCYASRHQMTIIDCLNDPDETLRRKVKCYILLIVPFQYQK